MSTCAVESREETSKYTDVYEDGTARKWTWVMDAKSVITSPSPQMPDQTWAGPDRDFWSWPGLAMVKLPVWTCLQRRGYFLGDPRVLGKQGDTKALTRFYLDTELGWRRRCCSKARAMDETGYVQPTKEQLREHARRECRLPQ